MNWLWLGATYNQIENYEEALLSFEQILKLNKQFGHWRNQNFYDGLSHTYLQLGEYSKAQKILEEGYLLIPESTDICHSLAVCALLQNDTIAANQYAKQFISSFQKIGNYYPESWRISQVAKMYAEAGLDQKAEEIYRQALKMRLDLTPEEDAGNPGNNLYWYYHNLGNLLIDNSMHLEEGMDYLDKAMELSMEDYGDHHPFVLHSLGTGYYKQDKFGEALQVLKKAEENMSVYDHHLHQLIQETEQALASQN